MHIVEAAALSANGSDPQKESELRTAIALGLQEEGIDSFVSLKEAINIYVELKEHHFPEFPDVVHSLKLPWVLSYLTDEDHARARAQMTEEQRKAMDHYHDVVARVLADA